MGLVPDTKPAKTAFFRSKIAPWTAAPPTAIGTTTGAVTALDVLVTAAEDKLAAQTSAEAVFRAAVAAAEQAVEDMAKAGADIISAIRTKGRTDGAVWELAQPGVCADRVSRGERTEETRAHLLAKADSGE